MEINISLIKNKPKYTSNLGENDYRVYTPGETITEQKDFMRFVGIKSKSMKNLNF